jgi:hypothetical protein
MQVSVEDAKDGLPRLLEAVPARPSGVRLGGLAGVVAPPPAAFLDPTGEDGLRDWGGA